MRVEIEDGIPCQADISLDQLPPKLHGHQQAPDLLVNHQAVRIVRQCLEKEPERVVW